MTDVNPYLYGTDPESRFEAALHTEHLAHHRAARGTQLYKVACPECRTARFNRLTAPTDVATVATRRTERSAP